MAFMHMVHHPTREQKTGGQHAILDTLALQRQQQLQGFPIMVHMAKCLTTQMLQLSLSCCPFSSLHSSIH